MKLKILGLRAEETVHKITRAASLVPVTIIFLMMLMVTVDVGGRYLFNRPLTGTMDFIEMAMVIVVFLGLAQCNLVKGNIRVDVIYSRLPERLRWVLDRFGTLASIFIFALVTWQLTVRGLHYIMEPPGSMTMLLHIQHSYFMLIAALGSLVLCLELVVDFFRNTDY